jgi:predicted phage terminase large subunit-like protein
VIQQRLAENDLTGHILEKQSGDWTHLCLPMEFEKSRSFVTTIGWQDPREEEGELLWPERFGPAEIKSLESALGPWAAAGQLQQRPEPKGGGIIKRDWWELWPHDAYPAMDYVIASLDTAYTTKSENDYSAMTVWGVFSGDVVAHNVKAGGTDTERSYAQQSPRAMLMDGWQERLELHDLVEKVAKTCRTMKIDKLIIENKAAGHSVAQEIRRLFGHEDWAVQLVDPKSQDKLSRLYSVQHLFSEGMVYAPDRSWADTVMTQVGTFPKGKHDDLVDTVSMCLRHLRDLGLLTRGPEMVAQVQESMQHRGRDLPALY